MSRRNRSRELQNPILLLKVQTETHVRGNHVGKILIRPTSRYAIEGENGSATGRIYRSLARSDLQVRRVLW